MYSLLVADSDSSDSDSDSDPSSDDACAYYDLLDEYMMDMEAQPPFRLVRLDRPAPEREPGRQEPAPGPPRPDQPVPAGDHQAPGPPRQDQQGVDVNNNHRGGVQPADGGASRPRRRWVRRLLQPFCIRK